MMRILHVDDDPLILELVTEIFRRSLPGAQVQGCGTAGEALKYLRSHEPALVLLDENLPDMKASELLDQMRSESIRSQAKVILMTGTVYDEMPDWAREREVLGYIRNPFRPQAIIPHILEYMAWDRCACQASAP